MIDRIDCVLDQSVRTRMAIDQLAPLTPTRASRIAMRRTSPPNSSPISPISIKYSSPISSQIYSSNTISPNNTPDFRNAIGNPIYPSTASTTSTPPSAPQNGSKIGGSPINLFNSGGEAPVVCVKMEANNFKMEANNVNVPPGCFSASSAMSSMQQAVQPRAAADEEKQKPCNCKKSRCLKLYCECFARQGMCTGLCNCANCCNVEAHLAVREKAIIATLERDPNAFFRGSKSGLIDKSTAKHRKGCNCKKSECLKKYCECFQAGVPCSGMCKCVECRNGGPESLARKKRKAAAKSKVMQQKVKNGQMLAVI